MEVMKEHFCITIIFRFVRPGYFDQQYRQNLFTTWASHLEQANVQFRPDIARVEVRNSVFVCCEVFSAMLFYTHFQQFAQ